jgi:hypothetical protein
MAGVVDDIDMQDAASDVSQFSEDKVDNILHAAFDQLVDYVERQVCVTRPLLDVHTVSRCTTMLLQVDLCVGKDHELHDTWIRPTALGYKSMERGLYEFDFMGTHSSKTSPLRLCQGVPTNTAYSQQPF